jgi:hypothetical protein
MIKLEITFDSLNDLQGFLTKSLSGHGVAPKREEHKVSGATAITEDGVITEVYVDSGTIQSSSGMVTLGAPDFAAVKQAILELSKAKGRDAALAVLGQFADKNGAKCEKVTAVLEKDYAGLLEAAKSAAA